MPCPRCNKEWGEAKCICIMNADAFCQEQGHDITVAGGAGAKHGGMSLGRLSQKVCAMFYQERGHIGDALHARDHQRRSIEVVSRIYRGRRCNKYLGDLRVPG